MKRRKTNSIDVLQGDNSVTLKLLRFPLCERNDDTSCPFNE